ncbi:seipin-2-like [Abrus precatorius]|uniref:Seipin-2-like n=1 Tax=Abrus precatorius TaxID=3816 RepID=A0A8B8KTW2_ABRPR|nr:seipin-2-like [Abrus precatorius]
MSPFPMDPPLQGPNNQHDDVFFDALPQCPFHHCSGDADKSPESSCSASIICDPDPPSPFPATTVRRRSTRRRSPVRESNGSDGNSVNGAETKFRSNQNFETSKENENLLEKCYSNREKVRPFQSPSVVTEERSEESTLTTAENDDGPGDSADSAAELGDSPSNSLEYVAALVIRAIMFQIKIFIVLMKCPMLFMLHACMFFVDPFGTIRKGKGYFVEILGEVWCWVCGCLGPSVQGWFKEHKSLWNAVFRCGWGLLWSIYVCFILFALLVSSLVVGWFLVKCLVEKPFQMRQVLKFDYTKQSPVAFVPIMSCAGVGGGQDYENDMAVSRWTSKRVIPANQKVLVTVSLLVPESGYNTNLGVFQIRVDFLSSDGKTIASSSQPCMLKFTSEPIRVIMVFLKIVPLVTGYISETQTLNVKMRGFVEGHVPTSCLKVTLEQRAEYPPGAGIPQIYDSSVVIESELPLFKRIIWHLKMGIFAWITMMTFMMELLLLLLALVCCWPIMIPRTRQRSGSESVTGAHS